MMTKQLSSQLQNQHKFEIHLPQYNNNNNNYYYYYYYYFMLKKLKKCIIFHLFILNCSIYVYPNERQLVGRSLFLLDMGSFHETQ
jgi:hypothetical protein